VARERRYRGSFPAQRDDKKDIDDIGGTSLSACCAAYLERAPELAMRHSPREDGSTVGALVCGVIAGVTFLVAAAGFEILSCVRWQRHTARCIVVQVD
jgi:hypothetical protein